MTREMDVIVACRRIIADGVALLGLRRPDGAPLPEWSPGAHIDLLLAPGLSRQYSLTGPIDPSRAWWIAVLLDQHSRGGSRFVHERLTAGATARVRGPRNHFPLISARRYLFVAGGIGITPLLPMIRSVHDAGRPWQLLYGGRSRMSLAFLNALSGHGDRVRIRPHDEYGLLDLDSFLGELDSGTRVYCCGPNSLLDAVEQRCPSGSLHMERFSPREAGESPSPDGFDVVLARSGRTLHVSADRSILEVLEDAGQSPLSSCTEGVCGTCETKVLDGRPDHRDSVLTAEERDCGSTMMICVSRSRTPSLTLDL